MNDKDVSNELRITNQLIIIMLMKKYGLINEWDFRTMIMKLAAKEYITERKD